MKSIPILFSKVIVINDKSDDKGDSERQDYHTPKYDSPKLSSIDYGNVS